MIESGLLKALLLNVIFGGIAGVAIWRFVKSKAGQALRDRLAAWLGYFGLEPPEVTRYLTMILSVLVSLVAYGVALAFTFVPNPGNAEGWLNLIIQLFGIAYAMSQVCHARRKTRLVLRQRQHLIDPTTSTEIYRETPEDDKAPCHHEFFKCQVPAGDSCVAIYHNVCRKCRWDKRKGIYMPLNIWQGWAVPQLERLDALECAQYGLTEI